MSDSTVITAATSPAAGTNDFADDECILSNSELLSRAEVLSRRSRRLKRLSRVYKKHYWCMIEELKLKYRKYYWEFGKSPSVAEIAAVVKIKNEDDDELGLGFAVNELRVCGVHGCKMKAMALTRFCHAHILSDCNQKLYMSCNYVIKSSQAGPIICGKPILKCTVPSLCAPHFQKAEKHVARALKKAGLNVSSSSSKLAPKFHVIIAEYVGQIQSNRRVIEKEIKENLEVKEEEISI